VDAIQIELNQRCYADPTAVDARVMPLPYDPARIRKTGLQLERALLHAFGQLHLDRDA